MKLQLSKASSWWDKAQNSWDTFHCRFQVCGALLKTAHVAVATAWLHFLYQMFPSFFTFMLLMKIVFSRHNPFMMNYQKVDTVQLKNMTTLTRTIPPQRQIKYWLASATLNIGGQVYNRVTLKQLIHRYQSKINAESGRTVEQNQTRSSYFPQEY